MAVSEVQLVPVAPRLAGRALAIKAVERERHVRMADDADPLRLHVEAELGLKRREHVLPDRVARARVVEADHLLFIRGTRAA